MCSVTNETPRIYVACLASYNSGTLHGRWIDCDQDADDIRAEIAAMLRESPEPNVLVDCPDCNGAGCPDCGDSGQVPSAEEFAIHDFDFGGLHLEEYEDIDDVAKWAALIVEHGPAFAAYADTVGTDYATADGFQDAYRGEWDSEQAYAEEFYDDVWDIPEHLESYIDWERVARDLFINDCVSADNPAGGVFVFDRN